jgi:sorbitol-specific phosphotransferase system component IIC
MLLVSLWSLATPLYSAPDEPAHVIKAAAVVRGEFGGREVATDEGVVTFVRVPSEFERANVKPRCYAFQSNVPAGCAEDYKGSDRDGEVMTRAGRYPPLYYLLVGLPSLPFSSAPQGVYLMRLLSGALCAAFLASALASAFEMRRSPLFVLGVAVAATPMVIYLAATVNPSSLATSAAICLWASGLALIQTHRRHRPRRLAARAGASASVLVLMHGLSPLLVALILIALAGVAGRRELWSLVKRRAVRRWLLIFVVASTLGGYWLLTSSSFDLGRPIMENTSPSLTEALRTSLGNSDRAVREMIGVFGWLDTPSPGLTYYLWLFAVGFLVVLGMALSSLRVAIVTTLVLLVTIALPVVLQTPDALSHGFVWQGRYGLPLAAGVPILAAFGPARRPRALGIHVHRMATVLIVALVIAHGGAFAWALRRYTSGRSGKLAFFVADGWEPPLPIIVLLVAFALGAAVFGWWLHLLSSPSRPSAVNRALGGPLTLPAALEPNGVKSVVTLARAQGGGDGAG